MQKPKQIEDEGKKLKLSPKKNRKTLAGQKQTEELSKEPSDKKGLRPTKKTRAKTQNHENHEDQEDQEATARTAGTAAGKPAKPKATEDVEAEQQRRALQREIQQLVMRLRREGKTPAEIKSATKELKAKSDWTKKEKLPKAKKEKQRLWEETAAKKTQRTFAEAARSGDHTCCLERTPRQIGRTQSGRRHKGLSFTAGPRCVVGQQAPPHPRAEVCALGASWSAFACGDWA